MKYIVEVNVKYLVSIEAKSCLDAEHKILDYNGVWGALAFDQQMTKTDTFLGAVQGCEMVSMNELISMVNDMMDKKLVAVKAIEEAKEAAAKVEELKAMLKAAEEAQLNANRAMAEAQYQYERAEEKIGKERR